MIDNQYADRMISILESAMKYNSISYPQVAEMLTPDGKKPARQSIFKKVKSGTLRATTMLHILDMLGMNVKIEKDGREIPVRLPVGDRVRKTVKGKKYDTKRCLPVANSFYADGKTNIGLITVRPRNYTTIRPETNIFWYIIMMGGR